MRGIAFTEFGAQDVVRHPLVARIIDAYEKHAQEEKFRVQYAVSRRGVPSAGTLRKWAALVPLEAPLRIVGAAEGKG